MKKYRCKICKDEIVDYFNNNIDLAIHAELYHAIKWAAFSYYAEKYFVLISDQT